MITLYFWHFPNSEIRSEHSIGPVLYVATVIKTKRSNQASSRRVIENAMIHLPMMDLEFWKYVGNFFAIKEGWIVENKCIICYLWLRSKISLGRWRKSTVDLVSGVLQ